MSKNKRTDEYSRPFPRKLREILEKTKTTQEQLAAHCGVSHQTISNYINGISKPDIYSLKSIADYFRVSVDYLLKSEEEPIYTPRKNNRRFVDEKYGPPPLEIKLPGLEEYYYLEQRFREACIDYGGKSLYQLCADYLGLTKRGQKKVREYVSDLANNSYYDAHVQSQRVSALDAGEYVITMKDDPK